MMYNMYYPTPLEDFPEREREEIARARMDEYIEQNYREGGIRFDTPLEAGTARTRMERISFCRALWNDELSDNRYDYLYNKVDKRVYDDQAGIDEILTLEMPARVRNIPIIRPKLQAIISKEKMRPLITKVVGMTPDMVDKKLDRIKTDIIEKQMKKIAIKRQAQDAQMQLFAQQQQLIQEMGQDPNAQQLIMQMQSELEQLRVVAERDIVITREELETIKEYYQYTHKEFEEQLCSQALDEFIDSKKLRHIINDAFKELMITGEPIFYVNWESGLSEPEFRLVHPEHVWYQYNEACKYIKQLDWLVEYQPLSIGQVIQMYGHRLKQEQLDRIRVNRPHHSQDAYFRTNLANFPDGSPAMGYGTYDYLYAHEVDVYKVYWKEQVEVYALYSENKNESNYFSEKPPFVRFLSAEEYKSMTDTDAKKEKMKRKGQVIKKAYRVDLWEGVRIGDDIYCNIQKVDFQYRTTDRLSDVDLPYVGFANNKFYKAYSLVWETKDIQELYNILHYQEELLIALSGVKGIIYDLSQMPTGMTPQEVMYYFKQGLGLIETVKPGGKAVRTTFNQFATYDMTVSPAIQTITLIKEQLNNIVGEITGATRQQTGQVAATDQVGTSQMALQQSNVVIEAYYQTLDELVEDALTRLCNIFPYAYAEGKRGLYVVGKERQEILNIQKDQLKGEFRTMVNSGSKEREIMQQAKQIAQMKFQQGQVSASNLIDMLDTDTMFEMRRMLKKYENEAMAKAEQMQQQGIEQQKQAQMEIEQLKMQMATQMEQVVGQVQAQLAQLKGQIELQKEQVKLQQNAQELEFKTRELQSKEQLEREKIKNEKEVEMAYLNFQYTELQVNAMNQKAQMLINRAKTAIDINKSQKKERVKD